MPYFFFFAMTLFIVICVLLILLVLIQKGRGGGLSGAFGGAGGNTAFGTKTGDVLTWATSIVFGVFLVLAVTLNLVADHVGQAQPQARNVQPAQGGAAGGATGAGIPPSTQRSR